MFSWISSYFWPQKTIEDKELEEAFSILEKAAAETLNDEPAEEQSLPEFMCSYKTGYITVANPPFFVIDDLYSIESDLENLEIGVQVSFVVHLDGGKVLVSNVAVLDNEWGCPQEINKSKGWCKRTLLTKVVSREGRKLSVSPGDAVVDLDAVEAEFIPIVGDWVELSVKCTIDETVSDLFGDIVAIEKMRPVRPRVLKCRVISWNAKTNIGVLTDNIFFNNESFDANVEPVVGQQVAAEVIESDQGMCKWRCIKMFISSDRTKVKNEKLVEKPQDFELERNEVSISNSIQIKFDNFNQNKSVCITLANKSNSPLNLLDIRCDNINVDIVVTNLSELCKGLGPNKNVYVQLSCRAKSIGSCRELLLFEFENFTIGRWITVTLNIKNDIKHGHFKNSINKGMSSDEINFRKNNQVIRGQNTSQRHRFILNRLGDFSIPVKLLSLMELNHASHEDKITYDNKLLELKPNLNKELTYQTYEDVFHTLLHLEEMQIMRMMQKYNKDQACFIRNGEFLMLEVENLAEKRPSLIIGDKILAMDPNKNTRTILEGVIHKVGGKHVYLKFSPNFHQGYNGEDYKIVAEHSRSVYKKMHHAIHLVMRTVGRDLLFPNKIFVKEPQLTFYYDHYGDELNAKQNPQLKANLNANTNDSSNNDENTTSPPVDNSTSCLEQINNSSENAQMNNSRENASSNASLNASNDSVNTNEVIDDGTKTTKMKSYKELSKFIRKSLEKSPEPKNEKITKPTEDDENTQIELVENVQPIQTGTNSDEIKVESKLLLNPTKPQKKTQESPASLKLEWFNKSLNFYQKEAVRNVLQGEARPLPYIIFGPPGTGKTITVIEIILQILRLMPHSRILVATPSNSAANLIATRLIQTQILQPGDMVRLCAYRCVVEESIPVELVPYSATVSIAKEDTTWAPQTMSNGLTLGITSSVIGRHRITIGTCMTLSGLYHSNFPAGHFTHFIIDEAGQCLEPEIMIPLSMIDKANGQIVLAGDPMQLNPVVLSEAKNFGLDLSYLERVINRFPYMKDIRGFPLSKGYDPRLVTKLIYNYRSLPQILTVPNKLFYDSELQAIKSSTNSDEAKFLSRIKDILPCTKGSELPAVVFHGVSGINYQTEDSPSWFNPDEAAQVFMYINDLYRLGISASDIGIISPYLKQVKHIRFLLEQAEFEVPKIGTVEEFQGQECSIIIISTVRSTGAYISKDLQHSLGFVRDSKRFNVALTRAQSLLIVVGNPNLLVKDNNWKALVEFCIKNGFYRGCSYNVKC